MTSPFSAKTATHRPPRRLPVALLVPVLLLAGCMPDASAPSAAPDTVSGRVDPATLGELTLRVWDQEVRGSQNEAIEALNLAFHDRYPNITIERHAQSFDDLQATGRLALTGPEAPDVIQANNSRSQMGAFVKGGMLRPLDAFSSAYGWAERFPASVRALASYTDDGAVLGEGSLYGLPQAGEVVGVYANAEKMAELGLDVPATWDEFVEQLGRIRAAGETPLVLGDQDKWAAIHVFGPIQGAHADPAEISKLALGAPGADWTDEANVAAASQLAEWVKSGWFNSDVLGVTGDDAFVRFSEGGEGVYFIGGSWFGSSASPQVAASLRFFAPPPVSAGAGPATTGGTSLPFAITSASKHPEVAAAYIDFLTSDDAMEVIASKGNLPVLRSAELAPSSGVVRDIHEVYDQVTTKGHLLPYLDYATPTFGDTLGAALQDLIAARAGERSVQVFLDALQKDYAEFTG